MPSTKPLCLLIPVLLFVAVLFIMNYHGLWSTARDLLPAASLSAGGGAYTQASSSPAQLLELFPPSAPPLQDSATHITQKYSPSGSSWRAGLSETSVFQALVTSGTSSRAWQLRVGKGGQIYSLRTPAGEAIPPQDDASSSWVDAVYEPVAVNQEKNQQPWLYALQAGIYQDDPTFSGLFYAPTLAQAVLDSGASYATVNWYQQAHVPSPYTSGLLVYTKYHNMGKGAIEVTNILYNFGNYTGDTLDYFNTPWSIVRDTTYPAHYLSDASGTPVLRMGNFRDNTPVPTSQTAGWSIFTDTNPVASSSSLAFVFGQVASTSAYRYGVGAKPSYDEFVATARTSYGLPPGQALLSRYYLAVGTYASVQQIANALAGDTVFAPIGFATSTTPLAIWKYGSVTMCTFAYPVTGSVPLFLLQHRGGAVAQSSLVAVSADPYVFTASSSYNGTTVYRPYDGHTAYVGFAGFAYPSEPADSQDYVKISSLITNLNLFPANDPLNANLWVPNCP